MEEFNMKAQETHTLTKVVCNCCGKEIPLVREGIWEEYFHGEKSWGYLSKQDGRQDSFDLCQECYEKMLETFKIK
ncbi:MAG: hypothetical protein EOM28_03995 [Clostridia bacterium]|nr:hypothetical protein [Clostridia bacterium]